MTTIHSTSRLTILFDAPYWIGLVELEDEGVLYAARHIFGAEPSDQEVYEFVLREVTQLLASLTTGISLDMAPQRPLNFKRMQRETKRAILNAEITSKAHEAMRVQLEQHKQERQIISREEREVIHTHKRAVAEMKAKARHRGR
ncbi:MAG: YjdF family protein [Anaerolineae bacterium]|nr:YjdF family protein [Anaerolineae bacterium]